jgi:hypothetical protein
MQSTEAIWFVVVLCLRTAADKCPRMSYKFSISLIEGRLREGTFGSGASAVPPRGLATRSGAALGIIPFGITAEA